MKDWFNKNKSLLLKFIYFLRFIAFVFHIFVILSMLENIFRVGILGYLFIILDIIFDFRVLYETFKKKENIINDIYYNLMQIGFVTYLSIFAFKLKFNNILLSFSKYFESNYIIFCILIVFLLVYSFLIDYGFNNKKEKVNKNNE